MPTLPTLCVTGKLECSNGTFTSAEDFIRYILPWREVQAFDCPEGS